MRAVARTVFGIPMFAGGYLICLTDSWQGWVVPILLIVAGDYLAEYGYTGRVSFMPDRKYYGE